MSLAVIGAYLVGAVAGWAAHRQARLASVWPMLVRAQIMLASVLLSVAAAWRLSTAAEMVWPGLLVAAFAVVLAASYVLTPAPQRAGLSALRAWTAFANTSYFGIPVAGALAGPAGVGAAVLVDRLGLPVWSLTLWMLRRDAPIPQHVRTSWVDQSPLIAFVVGLLLKFTGQAPSWTVLVSAISAPVLAASGAALFVGSVLHPTQRLDPRPGVMPWLRLIVVRVVLVAPLVVWAPTRALGVVAVLMALSIPAFGPSQMSTVYGYADATVAASARYGWVLGGVGLVAAWWIGR
ncbi:MAG: hypothetical protein IPJ14_02250 [Kineosporiaceae bacterium]|nr:hypothetical protein [Kineosporiaceae bacterium]